jgi:phosphatidylglycerophosphatase A
MRDMARFIAAGFGTGYAPVACGTMASFAATFVGGALLYVSPLLLLAAAVICLPIGYLAIQHAEVKGDPNWVVIDEFAGQWITLLGLSAPTVSGLCIAFFLFRVLDIAKPGPIGWADQQEGAVGIMSDDLVAGAGGALLLTMLRLIGGVGAA